MHTQLVRFRLTDEIDTFLDLSASAGAFLQAQPGFLGRDLFVAPDGVWHGVIHWTDAATADAATALWADHPLAGRIGALTDPDSLAITALDRRHHDHGRHLEPTQQNGRAFVMQQLDGAVDMLNLLRFRDEADYSAFPDLAPPSPISGREAYARYAAHTLPFLDDVGATVLYDGTASSFLIGPTDPRWDRVLIVRHRDTAAFLSFATNEAYLAGLGHRTAALADSRLLPMQSAQRAG